MPLVIRSRRRRRQPNAQVRPVWRLCLSTLTRSPLQDHPYSVTLTRSSISNYDSRYRDPNRDRDRNRRESKEFDPDSDSDFDFDCTDVP